MIQNDAQVIASKALGGSSKQGHQFEGHLLHHCKFHRGEETTRNGNNSFRLNKDIE
jgi:hypothetical protein